MTHCYVDLPNDGKPVFLYDQTTGEKVRQVLWGDWLKVDGNIGDNADWVNIDWAWQDATKRKKLKIPRKHISLERPLEIAFVDVAQGDGAVLITPETDEDERIIVIDAGEEDHMLSFLKQRFMSYRQDYHFHAAIVTHPDKDHYHGFQQLFDYQHPDNQKRISFEHFYHNGIAERPTGDGWNKLGGKIKIGSRSFLNDLADTHNKILSIFTNYRGKKKYPSMISTAIANQSIGTFTMLSTEHGQLEHARSWLPGFTPSEPRGYEVQILGPYVEKDNQGNPLLRTFSSSTGKTKNGHSIILRLTYGDIAILFGGDLNEAAEKFLLQQYAGLTSWPRSDSTKASMIETAKRFFRSDVMKSCHHGSSDVTDEFLRTVDPFAFIISSGDHEGHVHPRPDLLGRLGKNGRTESPIILSTELQRSTREKEDEKLVKRIKRNIEYKSRHSNNPARAAQIEKKSNEIEVDLKALGRSNVDVDGTIYIKTNGEKLIAAFKKETDSPKDKWFYFEYEVQNRELVLTGMTNGHH